MTMFSIPKILTTTALCLAVLVGLSSCIQSSKLGFDDADTPVSSVPSVTECKLKPFAQQALDKTLSGSLVPIEAYDEDITEYLQQYSVETRYIM